MTITKEGGGAVTLGNALALTKRESEDDNAKSSPAPAPPHRLFIEVRDLDAAHRNMALIQANRLSELGLKDGRRHFSCVDPDGVSVDVFEQRS
jgi:hypothetical protein